MLEWDNSLRIAGSPLHLDARRPRGLSFVSHAHSDHTAPHGLSISTAATARLAAWRIGAGRTLELGFDEPHELLEGMRISLHHAGHVLGSAMIRVETAAGSLLYTGDFKLRPSATTPAAMPVSADHLVMESTFGRPFFRFPPRERVIAEFLELVEEAMKAGRQPIVLAYSLGKSQEAVRILADAGFNVTCHGAPHSICRIYESLGVGLGAVRRYRFEDFHGARQLDLRERGVLVAPPHAARTGFVTRFANPCRMVLTGWALLKNASFRYGVDHALPLSDHADFDELLELVDRVAPRKIYTHHGYKEFAEHLRARGHDATTAVPDPQLSLF